MPLARSAGRRWVWRRRRRARSDVKSAQRRDHVDGHWCEAPRKCWSRALDTGENRKGRSVSSGPRCWCAVIWMCASGPLGKEGHYQDIQERAIDDFMLRN